MVTKANKTIGAAPTEGCLFIVRLLLKALKGMSDQEYEMAPFLRDGYGE